MIFLQKKYFFLFSLSFLFLSCESSAEKHQRTMDELVQKLSQSILNSKKTRIAVAKIEGLSHPRVLRAQILEDKIITKLATVNSAYKVIDRQNLKILLEEKGLEEDGLLNPTTTSQIGKALGLDALIKGTAAVIGVRDVEFNFKIIDIESGTIIEGIQDTIEYAATN